MDFRCALNGSQLWKAITAGESKFKKIAIVSDAVDFCPPCGACRQVMFELAGDIEIYMTNKNGAVKRRKTFFTASECFHIKNIIQWKRLVFITRREKPGGSR